MSGGVRWLAGDPALRAQLAPLLADPARAGDALRPLREQPGHRRLARAKLADGRELFLKIFARSPRRHRLRESFKRRLHLDAARREWRALVALHARGVAVPEPLALAELADGGLALATRFVAGATLEQTLADARRAPRELLLAVGGLVAQLHAAGFAHGDLHHGNLLIAEGRVWLVDLQAARGPATRRARLRDLGELDHSLAGALSRSERTRLAARALGLVRPFDARARRELRAAVDASERRARAHARSRARRAGRPGRRYARLRAGTRTGLRWRAIDEAPLLRALAAHALAGAGATPARDAAPARSRVSCVDVDGVRVALKEWGDRGRLQRLVDGVRGSPAARAFRAGIALRARRIGAATPYAFLEEKRLGLPVRSWLWLEDLRPALPADTAVRELAPDAIADALASLLLRLHRAGVRHGDLKASHIFLAPGGAPLEARLIDLESVRFGRRVSERARLLELAQLNASLPDALPDTLRCRAFDRYRRGLPFRIPAQQALRRVVAASLARGHRWSGSGCELAREPGAERLRPGS